MSVRTNIMYSKIKEKDKEDVYKRYQELIFLVDKPAYTKTNDGQIVRERHIEEQRFFVSDEAFEELLKILTSLKDVEPEELTD